MALACSRELIVLQNSLTHTQSEVPGSQPVLLCPDSWERPLESLGSCSSSWLCGSVALGTSLSSASSCQGSCQALFGGLCSLCLNCHHLILSVFLVKAWQVCDISWSLTVLGVGDFWVTPGPFGGANPAGCWLCPVGLPVVLPSRAWMPKCCFTCAPSSGSGCGAISAVSTFWGWCGHCQKLPRPALGILPQPSNPSAHEAQNHESWEPCASAISVSLPVMSPGTHLPQFFFYPPVAHWSLVPLVRGFPAWARSAALIFLGCFSP